MPNKTELFIVTYAKDYPWLVYCLRSIAKFATGFSGVTILVPRQDLQALLKLAEPASTALAFPVCCISGDEWPGKGMCWHMAQKMRADEWCPAADFVCHIDPDCVFTAPVTPETFIRDGKPILQYERFDSILLRHEAVLTWKLATEKCLPFDIHFETMRQHGETYDRQTYRTARELVEQKTQRPFDDYVKSCKNEFPQTISEFVTLGNVAIHCFSDKYHLVDNALKPNPDKGDFPIFQAWSHASPDQPVDLWYRGEQIRIIPLDFYKELGLA